MDQYQSAVIEITDLFHRTNLKDKEQVEKLSNAIDRATLPRYHKEILKVVFLTPDPTVVPMAVHVVTEQQMLRHHDSLVKIQQKAIAERLKRSEV